MINAMIAASSAKIAMFLFGCACCAALACAPLGDDPAGWPKFKGMEAGALGWLRGG